MAVIGSIGPSTTQLRASQPRAMPGQFGEGVARALGGLGQALDQAEDFKSQEANAAQSMSLALKDRQKKLDTSRVTTDLITLRSDLGMELATAQQEAGLGAVNFTNQRDSIVAARLADFASKIPPELREDFAPRLEELRTNLAENAFSYELNAQGQAYNLSVAQVTQRATNDILSGKATREDWQAELDALYYNSPLDAAATETLYREVNVLMETASLSRRLQDEVLAPDLTPGKPSALPGPAVAFLETVSSGEAEGYDIMYKGGSATSRRFTDFSKHPNQPTTITEGPHKGDKSTAAGKYQFIFSTWERARKALNLTDFSPESQDKAAWWLAQEDYRAKSGRELLADLSTGDPIVLAGIRRSLAGTWDSFRTTSDTNFVAKFNGARTSTDAGIVGKPPAFLNEAQYENIPYTERMKLWGQAQDEVIGQMKRQQDLIKAQGDAALNSMLFSIADPETKVTRDDIDELITQHNLPFSAREKLYSEWEGQNMALVTTERISGELSVPGAVVQPSKDVDTWATSALLPALATGDIEQATAAIVPFSTQMGFLPAPVANQLSSLTRSATPGAAVFAYDLLANIQKSNPAAVASLPDDVTQGLAYYQSMAGLKPAEQLVADQRFLRDPANAGVVEQVNRQLDQYMQHKDNAPAFTPAAIADTIDLPMPSDMQGLALQSEYTAAYRDAFLLSQDHEMATKLAGETVKKRWGSTELGGTEYLMKLPPESSPALPTHVGGYGYLDTQVRTALELAPGQKYRLISDAHTEADFKTGTAPRYLLQVEQMTEEGESTGFMLPLYDETGRPKVFQFEYTEEMKSERLDAAAWENEVQVLYDRADALNRDYREIPFMLGGSAEAIRSEREILNEERAEVMAEIARLEGAKPAFTQDQEAYRKANKPLSDRMFSMIKTWMTTGPGM